MPPAPTRAAVSRPAAHASSRALRLAEAALGHLVAVLELALRTPPRDPAAAATTAPPVLEPPRLDWWGCGTCVAGERGGAMTDAAPPTAGANTPTGWGPLVPYEFHPLWSRRIISTTPERVRPIWPPSDAPGYPDSSDSVIALLCAAVAVHPHINIGPISGFPATIVQPPSVDAEAGSPPRGGASIQPDVLGGCPPAVAPLQPDGRAQSRLRGGRSLPVCVLAPWLATAPSLLEALAVALVGGQSVVPERAQRGVGDGGVGGQSRFS